MYWQVYYHKTAALAEHVLVQILNRAKYLVSQNVELHAPSNLKYFLIKNKFDEATEEDIRRFTMLDDMDVFQAIKEWTENPDLILAKLCKIVIYRDFPKSIISSKPFSEEFIQDKINKTNQFFNITNAEELVGQISRTLLPYDTEKQPIYLMDKNGNKFKLEESENQILFGCMENPTKKYIMYFPREIL